jgi:hypothetical protein
MSRRLISSGSDMELKYGYSRAVVDGKWVFVSGTTGFDYAKGEISDDITEQTRQVFRNIEKALSQAGASLADVVRALHRLQRCLLGTRRRRHRREVPGRAAGGDGDHRRSGRSAHEGRDRGHGPPEREQ